MTRLIFRLAGRSLWCVALTCAAAGCRSGFIDFPNRLIGSDGQLFTLEDLEAIADDPNLSTQEKRQAFRDLGIEDETLIDALLTL
jgi:hypothetical protein